MSYFPPGSPFPVEDLSLFLQTLNHTYIIGADFNAKHEAWGCRSKNTRGRTLHNFITIKRSKVISPASTQIVTPIILIFFYLISPITSIKIFLTLMTLHLTTHLSSSKFKQMFFSTHSLKNAQIGTNFAILCQLLPL